MGTVWQTFTPFTLEHDQYLELVITSLPGKTKNPPNRSLRDIAGIYFGKTLLNVQMESARNVANLIMQRSQVL